MELHNLKIAAGSTHNPKKVGRGIGSGMGKTSTRGQKGAGARSGGGIAPGFEGGAVPLYKRVPKRGFKNVNRKEYAVVNVGVLEIFEDNTVVDESVLLASGIVKDVKSGIKILSDGTLTKKLTVIATKFSNEAKNKIVKAGGEAKEI